MPTLRRAGTLLLAMVALVCLLGPAATAARAPVPVPSAGPYLGPILDWTDDSAREYADRFGTTPSLFGQSVRFPLNDDDRLYLRQYVDQIAQQGALALLTVEPVKPLDELTVADARALARELAGLHRRADTRFLVRFAPEMNGSWPAWGQQPAAYRAAFARVADAVHAGVPQAAMVWAPVYGAGYPFRQVDGATAADLGSDPYAPYWPGDDAVDWVGLAMPRYGGSAQAGRNEVPAAGEFAGRLDERFGYAPGAAPARSFYATYAEGKALPMVVETGAFYAAGGPGPTGAREERAIKRAWARQVLDEAVLTDHPRIAALAWLEKKRPEAAIDGRTVDWRITRDDTLADDFRAAAERGGARLGPVTRVLDQRTGNEATAQYREGGGPAVGRDSTEGDIGDNLAWIAGCVVLALVLWLGSGLAGRYRPQWRYPRENEARDDRLDFFRGWTIVAVVITHIELAGPWSFVTLNAIGGITGAEMFVLLSGVVLGMVYPFAMKRFGEWRAAVSAWQRARKQYLTALGVVVVVYLIGLLPFVSASAVTTFTDRGTGAAGQGASGQVYDLYANVERLLDYPPPWYAVRALLLLEMGPWVFNIMGLFVVLSLLVPVFMWLIRRRLWWVLLALSWGLYVLDVTQGVRLLPSQFEDVFPLLTWQVAFTHGLVIGYYRRPLTRVLTSRAGKAVVTALMVAYAAAMVWVWSDGSDGETYRWVYEHLYQRTYLQPGRLLDLALVLLVAHALLTTCWVPLDKAFGWFYVPLGRVSLYVFIVHVFFVVIVANIPGLDRTSAWQGLVIHAAVLAAIWFMVRRRFLFKVIPT